MSYKTFNFPTHQVTHAFPAGDQVQFGQGWTHASAPDGPQQRTLLLKFNALLIIKNPFTGAILRAADTRSNPAEQAVLDDLKKRSVWALNDFYEEHLLHKKFIYNHYVYGDMVVRFSQPFQMPAVLGSNQNVYDHIPTESFEVRLLEHPE